MKESMPTPRAAGKSAVAGPAAKKPAAPARPARSKMSARAKATPPPAPPVSPVPVDIRRMVADQKQRLSLLFAAGLPIPTADLQAIVKLEQRFEEEETFERLRRMTSYRSTGAEVAA
jgi:hypothetical protein